MEEAGKRVRDQAKVLKDQVEYRTGGKVKADSDIMQWLIRWAAMVQTRFKRKANGKTAYEEIKGRKCNLEVVPFGEKVWYKKLKESGESEDKAEMKWEEGIWLGHIGRTNEVAIGTSEGVVKAWAIRRRPEEERWKIEDVNGVVGTPKRPTPRNGEGWIPIRVSWETTRKKES